MLTPAGDAIRMAHPFSAAPMGFVVRAGDQFWWGGCAWDSFGITAALDRQMEITTCCAGCGRKLVYVAGPATPPTLDAVVLIPRPAREWWDDVVATCSSIRVYCRRTEMPTHAESVPVLTLWQLAQPWYGDRLDAGLDAAADQCPTTSPRRCRASKPVLAAPRLTIGSLRSRECGQTVNRCSRRSRSAARSASMTVGA